jgi:hypothetical protein
MKVVINLPTELGRELKAAAAACAFGDERLSPALWAQEAVESVLASRRLPKIAPGRYGARVIGAEKPEESPEPYRLCLPEDLVPASRGWE